MIAPTPFFADRGCHVRIYEEARILQSLGNKVEIVTYHIGRDMPGIVAHRIPAIPWYKKLEAGPSWHKPYLDIFLLFKALAAAKKFKPDLIHAHLHEGAFVGILLKKLLKIPLVFDYQGSLTGEITDHGFMGKDSLVARFFRQLESYINHNVDAIVTSSGPAAEDLMAKWKVPANLVTCLTDGVNTDEFFPGDRYEVRRALRFSSASPLVVYLGLFNHYQGTDLLLEVIRILKERGKSINFLLMGFPEARYRQMADDMGIADLITFTGRIEYSQASFYLSAGDVAVSPKISLTEANGKLFNYMACGLPCLVFDTPVNREILGDTGTYARFADPVDYADRLEEMLADPLGLEYQGGCARAKAVDEHSWKARGGRLVQLYQSLAA